MSVRKRSWKTAKGEQTAWLVAYVDQAGARRFKTFDLKKDADAYHATVKVEVHQGLHTAPSQSITVAEAADLWLTWAKSQKLERSTTDHYEQHVRLHINPRIGHEKLVNLTTPRVEKLKDQLVEEMSSRALARKVLVSLKAILKEARRLGKIAFNPAEGVTIRKDKKDNQKGDKKRKLKSGVDFPTLVEARTILNAASGKWRTLLMLAMLTGLRASEIRGLPWKNVDLKGRKLTIDQRADAYGKIGHTKSESSERTIPFGADVAKALTEWKLQTDFNKPDDLVFASEADAIPSYDEIARPLKPILAAAKVRYTPHKLRHFYASWCISRGVQAKVISERMGHSSITITMDLYGHLFEGDENYKEIDAAERALLA